MESIVKFLEKGQPYFDKVSKNIYLQAIKDGFLAAMPIILSSSVFLLISTLPGVVATVGGFTLPDWWNVDVVNFCNKVYNFTMGVVGIMVAGTTASALTGSKNRRMPAGKAINATSTMVAAMCAMLILAVTQTSAKIDGADVSVFFTDNMGTKGLLSSFVAAFATVNIYAFCIKRDITIKLPKEVPGAIAQNFRDIFAFSFSILFVAVIDVICRTCLAVPFANVISTLVSPLFAAADSYAGLALIWFMIPLFWFMGIHGPSVVKPALNAALFGNITTNLATLQAGGHPALALTENFGNYIGELGGTMEEEVAEAMEAKAFTKPLVAFMGGRTAPEGKRMGHAGAIVTGGRGTVKGKTEAIVKAGGKVAKRPSEVGALLKAFLG